MNRFLNRRSFVKASLAGTTGFMLRPVWAETNHYDVIVVGAGLSGLQSAYLLEQRGLNVLLLESNERIGGRVHTLDHLEGRPDAGGMQVGANYHQLRSIAGRLNVSLTNISGAIASGALSVSGDLIHPRDWPDHVANKLSESEKHAQPGYLPWKFLAETGPISSPQDWLNQEYRHLDIPFSAYLKQVGASDEALRLINSNFESDDINEVSALHTLRKFSVIVQSGPSEFIKNGASRLTEAMANSLKAKPMMNKMVTSISQKNRVLSVSCSDGSRYTANRCVLATPFSTVRNMDLQLPLSDSKRLAIAELAYNHIAQVYMKPKSDFWETDGFTPDLWTDSPIGMISAEKDSEGRVVLLRAWLIGNNARALDGLSSEEVAQFVVNHLESLRPAAKGQLSVVEVVNWGGSPHSLGAYAHFHPGDVGRFASAVARQEGQLYFAGEHTEFSKSGMEAAVVSAERCANEIFASL